jgi:group I intron endonuclease
MYGKFPTAETITKIQAAISGENNPLFGKKGKNHPLYGLTCSEETIAKISEAKGEGIIFVYNADKSSLVNSFPSARKAAEFFNSNHHTIIKYALNGLLFLGKWILSTSLITSIGDCSPES